MFELLAFLCAAALDLTLDLELDLHGAGKPPRPDGN
jgi:hypothetical protein